jgi:hypothetical protein
MEFLARMGRPVKAAFRKNGERFYLLSADRGFLIRTRLAAIFRSQSAATSFACAVISSGVIRASVSLRRSLAFQTSIFLLLYFILFPA